MLLELYSNFDKKVRVEKHLQPSLNLNRHPRFTITIPIKGHFKISATFCKPPVVISLQFPI